MRIKGLDGLRGIAILGIAFFYHYSVVYGVVPQNGLLSFLCKFGYLGVEIFFCISGFVLEKVYSEKIESLTFNEFMKKRIGKLMPLAILSTIVVAVLHSVIVSLQLPIFEHVWQYNNLLNFIFNICGVHTSLFPPTATSGQSFNLPLWFLSVVLVCYIFFFLYCKIKEEKNKMYCLLASILISIWVILNSPMGNTLPIANLYTARGILAFSLGIVGARIFQNNLPPLRTAVIMHICIMVWCVLAYWQESFLGNVTITFDLLVAMPLVILSSKNGVLQYVLEIPFLKWIGKISYSIYIWDFPVKVILLIIQYKVDILQFEKIHTFMFVFILTIIVAIISYKYGERSGNR